MLNDVVVDLGRRGWCRVELIPLFLTTKFMSFIVRATRRGRLDDEG